VVSKVSMHEFADRPAQARGLAASIAERLREGVRQRGQALLAVSGGTTPTQFFACLAQETLDWAKVCVTLVDERWVAADDTRSNARLVQTTLLQHAAAAASFMPLYTGAATPELGLAEAEARVAALPLPFDAVVLGMGDDGHTASFFPGGDHLNAALDLQGSARALPMRAPDAGEPRITLTLSTLLQTRVLYLLIAGADKRVVFDAAMRGTDAAVHYPIRAVLNQQRVPVAVYWSP
jgi:6-phosphogluconolactonase